MALKYYLEYHDTENILHRCEIYDDNYTDNSIEVNGSVFLDGSQTESVLESFRGSGIRIDLDADLDRKFTELFTSEERTFKAIYIRDGVTEFVGWVNPEGYFESFVADRWVVSVDVIDGLSFLSDLSYVDNSTGVPFLGRQSELEIISNCLLRTNLDLNINTNIDIYYDGLSTSLDVLANAHIGAERFVKDDEETIMSCEEVLRSVLEPYAACITMYQGEWWIYKPNQMFDEPSPTFFRYDKDGVALSPTTVTESLGFSLGSQIDGFYPHHANSNQSLSLKKALGAYRVNYKYGFIQSLLDNPFLEHNGVTITAWTINSSTNLTLDSSGAGVRLETIASGSGVLNLTSDTIAVGEGNFLKYKLNYEIISYTGSIGVIDPRIFNYKIILDGTTTYYASPGGTWTTTDTTLTSLIGTEEGLTETIEVNFAELPLDGDMYVEIYTPTEDIGATTDTVVRLNEFSISTALQDNKANLQGETHTTQRTTNPSIKVEDPVEVFVGDNPSEIYVGTIYENDESTPTSIWNRKGITEEFVLLRIMCEEHLRLNQLNTKLFSGDIYGYIPMLSVVNINNVSGKFMFIEYSYDTKNNTISGILKEIHGGELTDIDYQLTFDYGNVVRPTIKG